jgi:AcrR family transcriptional regulator
LTATPDTLRSPRSRQIVAAARELLEQDGLQGLSMRRVAERVGIRAPSLYKHLPDKRALEAALISDGLAEWADLAERAARENDDALDAVGQTYRSFAQKHPHLYRLMTERALPREALATGVEARAAQVMIDAAGDDANLARALWAFAHGMAILELNQRFPPDADLDAAWRRGLEALRGDSS